MKTMFLGVIWPVQRTSGTREAALELGVALPLLPEWTSPLWQPSRTTGSLAAHNENLPDVFHTNWCQVITPSLHLCNEFTKPNCKTLFLFHWHVILFPVNKTVVKYLVSCSVLIILTYNFVVSANLIHMFLHQNCWWKYFIAYFLCAF